MDAVARFSLAYSWCHLVAFIHNILDCKRSKENTICKGLSPFHLQAVITERKRSSTTENQSGGGAWESVQPDTETESNTIPCFQSFFCACLFC